MKKSVLIALLGLAEAASINDQPQQPKPVEGAALVQLAANNQLDKGTLEEMNAFDAKADAMVNKEQNAKLAKPAPAQ